MNKPRRQVFRRKAGEPYYKVNRGITASTVRLVGENVKTDIYPLQEALQIAEAQALDLVEVSPKADPPVCKVVDYAKFKYEYKKRQKALKAKVHKTVVKEIRFGPNTDDHDFNFKLNHAIKFLKDGAKVKVYVQFVGRAIVFKERGKLLLLKFAQALEAYGKIEQLPKMEGKRMILTVLPKRINK